MTENNNKKRWGRRLGLGIVAILHADVFYGIAVWRGLDIAWFKDPALFVFGIVLFVGGFLTATDIVNKWKQ